MYTYLSYSWCSYFTALKKKNIYIERGESTSVEAYIWNDRANQYTYRTYLEYLQVYSVHICIYVYYTFHILLMYYILIWRIHQCRSIWYWCIIYMDLEILWVRYIWNDGDGNVARCMQLLDKDGDFFTGMHDSFFFWSNMHDSYSLKEMGG